MKVERSLKGFAAHGGPQALAGARQAEGQARCLG